MSKQLLKKTFNNYHNREISKPGGFFKTTNSGVIVVGIGACALTKSPIKIKTFGLGSCLSITLYDRQERIGGLVHTMLPSISDEKK